MAPPVDDPQAVFLSIDGEPRRESQDMMPPSPLSVAGAEVSGVPSAMVSGANPGPTTPHALGPPPSAAAVGGYEELYQARRAAQQKRVWDLPNRPTTGNKYHLDQKISIAGLIVSLIGSVTVPFVITKYFDNEKNLMSEELDELKAWRRQTEGDLRSFNEKLLAQQTELRDLRNEQARAFVGIELQGIDRIRLQRGNGEFTPWESLGDLEARLGRVEEGSVVTALEFNERTGELLLRQGRGGIGGGPRTIQTQTSLHQAFTEASVVGTELLLTRLDAVRVTEKLSLVFNNSGELLPTYTKAELDDRLSRKLDATQLYVELGKKVDMEQVYSREELDGLLATKPDKGEVYGKTEVDALMATKPDSLAGQAVDPSGEMYYSKSEVDGLLAGKMDSEEIGYSKAEVDGFLAGKADSREVYSKVKVDQLLQTYCKKTGCTGQGILQPSPAPDTRPVPSGEKVCKSMGANTMETDGVQIRGPTPWVNTDLVMCEESCLHLKACVGFTYHRTYKGGACWLWSAYKAVGQAGDKDKSFSKCE